MKKTGGRLLNLTVFCGLRLSGGKREAMPIFIPVLILILVAEVSPTAGDVGMAPKRKVEAKAPSVKPSMSPRRTRSSSAKASPAVPPEAPPLAKKPKKASRGKPKEEVKESDEPALAVETVVADKDTSKTIIVEACKQCHQFKKRATMVKDGLENGVPGINVVVNPEKPRRGCFEIRDANGQTFVSLLNMPRPFTRMRELDMDALISDIIEKVK